MKITKTTSEIMKVMAELASYTEMMDELIVRWFGSDEESYRYTEFLEALIIGDLERMQNTFQELCFRLFSFFDGQKKEGEDEPEKFYHGFVLGLIVSLRGRYVIHSNQESGEGRYDISLEPLKDDDAILIEFKIFNSSEEKNLEGTCKRALKQIEEKKYDTYLLEKGIPMERIKKYGFGFKGKHTLIRSA